MKAKTIVLTMALCFVAAAVCFADDAFTGTWKLKAPQPAPLSTFRPLACRSATIVVVTTWIDEVVGGQRRLSVRPAARSSHSVVC